MVSVVRFRPWAPFFTLFQHLAATPEQQRTGVAMATVHLRNNTIVLYKRPRSTKWQAELRYPADGSIRRISTRTEDEHEAAAFAIQHYEAHRIAAKPLIPKRVFGEFCQRYRVNGE
jgi:hypothetical protein